MHGVDDGEAGAEGRGLVVEELAAGLAASSGRGAGHVTGTATATSYCPGGGELRHTGHLQSIQIILSVNCYVVKLKEKT